MNDGAGGRLGALACRAGVAVLFTIGAACAPRTPPAVNPWPARVAAADAAAAEGCYRCLERALGEYEEALAAQPDATLAVRAYRTAVHLAVRERLIGLYPGSFQDAPARLANGAAAGDVEAAQEVLGVLPWRRGTVGLGTGLPAGQQDLPRLRARRAALEATVEQDAWHAMLLLALVSANPFIALDEGQVPQRGQQPGLDRDTWWRRHPDDASLSFTRLTLLRGSIDDLSSFSSAHPSFAEVDSILGEAELARGRLVSADEALARALEALPMLVPALVLRADLRQRMEDFALATALYDQLLERFPDHREALLGRTKSLGFQGRHEEAIVTADRMLQLGTWYMGEAHYWKAWNLFTLRRIDPAREAVDAARRLMVNADVHYLGGAIALNQQRLADALTDFDEAIALEGRHCEAHYDRAAVHLMQRNWTTAAAGFDEAFECHTARTPVLEQRIADAREARVADDVRASLVARRERALLDHRHQLAWARYNGSVAYANVGKVSDARSRADEAISIGGPAAEAAQRLLPQLPAQ
jgi:tetratricopeptide (TPR) repeat protein